MDSTKPNSHRRIKLKVVDGYIFVSLDEIVRIEAHDGKLFVYLINREEPLKVLDKLSEVEKHLSPDDFICCHRRHIVNIDYIVKYETQTLTLITTQGEVPVAERRAKEFKNSVLDKF